MNRIRKQGHCAFFIFPDGESISIEDTERVLMRILEVRSLQSTAYSRQQTARGRKQTAGS